MARFAILQDQVPKIVNRAIPALADRHADNSDRINNAENRVVWVAAFDRKDIRSGAPYNQVQAWESGQDWQETRQFDCAFGSDLDAVISAYAFGGEDRLT